MLLADWGLLGAVRARQPFRLPETVGGVVVVVGGERSRKSRRQGEPPYDDVSPRALVRRVKNIIKRSGKNKKKKNRKKNRRKKPGKKKKSGDGQRQYVSADGCSVAIGSTVSHR